MQKSKKFSTVQKNTVAITTLLLVTFLVYLPLFNIPFLFDDFDFLFTWKSIHDLNHIPNLLLGETPLHHEGVFRPIRSLIYVASYHLFHHNIFLYHIQALLIYGGLVSLVYMITVELTQKRLLSFLNALIFAIMPIHIDNVANLTGSFDTAGVLFALCSFFLFQNYLRRGHTNLFATSLIFSALAYLTYEITLILPLLFLLYALFKKLTLSKPVLFLSFLLPALYLFTRAYLVTIPWRGSLLDNLGDKLSYFLTGTATYFLTSLLPAPASPPDFASFKGLLLFADSTEAVTVSQNSPILGTIALVLILLFIGVKLFAKNSLAGFGVLWFFVSLVATLPIALQSSDAYGTHILWGRYAILATFGISLLLSMMLHRLITMKPHSPLISYFRLFGTISAASLLASYVIVTSYNLSLWRDPRPQLLKQVQVQPENASKHNDLGVLEESYGRYGNAVVEFKKALKLDPSHKRAKQNLAKLCREILPNTQPGLSDLCNGSEK